MLLLRFCWRILWYGLPLDCRFSKFGSSSFDSYSLSISHFCLKHQSIPVFLVLDSFAIVLDVIRGGRGDRRLCWNQFHPVGRRFQMDQVTVGAGRNPTRRTVSKKVVHWSISCTISRASTASAHHNIMFLCFSVDVHDCLVRLDGQSVRDGLAAVEISRSSFRRFIYLFAHPSIIGPCTGIL